MKVDLNNLHYAFKSILLYDKRKGEIIVHNVVKLVLHMEFTIYRINFNKLYYVIIVSYGVHSLAVSTSFIMQLYHNYVVSSL